jgi:hypothetical protein
MSTLIDFGDAAVLLPLSVVILMWLLCDDSHRVVGSWVTAVGLWVAATALLKIYLYACPPAPDLVSPSGHSSLSTAAVTGCLRRNRCLKVLQRFSAAGWERGQDVVKLGLKEGENRGLSRRL